MIHPNTELRLVNPEIGYGVFATAFIPKGTIVYVKDSLEIKVSPKSYKKLDHYAREVVDKYSYRDEKGYRIISWDFAKYVNHSCQPNTISTGYGFEIAIQDIYPDEQITDEYAIFNLEQSFECVCRTASCRHKISPNDFEEYYNAWDEQIKDSLAHYFFVEQALEQYVESKLLTKLYQYLEMKKGYKSVYELKYRLNKGIIKNKKAHNSEELLFV